MKKLLLLPAILLFSYLLHAQNKTEDEAPVNNTVYEKVYLHLDREMYAPRETIWFKVYLVSGISNKPIIGYKNIYIQLVDNIGRVVEDRLLLVENGSVSGNIALPIGMKEGQYTMRAYTKYLQNFGEESYFHKKIWISTMKKQVLEIDSLANGIDVGFYPESGNLVLNASNAVAFKATGEDGRAIDVRGFVLDDRGDTITPFQTDFMGMGKFVLMPSEGRTYHAVISDYPKYNYTFGNIQPEGISMQFRDEPFDVKFVLARNFTVQEEQDLYLVASHKGTVLFQDIVKLSSFYKELSYSKGNFPLGITKISLLDDKLNIIAERLIFVQIENPSLIQIETDAASYSTRGMVKVSLSSFLPPEDSVLNGLSVSVVNRDYLTRDGYVSDMTSFLLLESELKGPIESPAEYFHKDEFMSSSEKLDLLMMVQGWRSYYWEDITNTPVPDLAGWEDIGLTVSGYVKRLLRDKRVVGGEVMIGPYSKNLLYDKTTTDSLGRFRIDRLFLRDSGMLIVQAKTERGTSSTEIVLDSMYTPPRYVNAVEINQSVMDPLIPRTFYSENFSKLEAEKKYAIESGTYWLDEVEIVSETPDAFLTFSEEETRIYGWPDHSYTITEEDLVYNNIYEYLESRVAGLVVTGEQISMRGGESPTIMIDGMIDDVNMIKYVSMGDIHHIDIIKNAVAMGSQGADGMISIYTNQGTITSYERYVAGRLTKQVNGFQLPRLFYSTSYNEANLESKIPDFRPTLFWEPSVMLEDNTAELEFYTSDFQSKYLILVEGISKKGHICTAYSEFKVKRENF